MSRVCDSLLRFLKRVGTYMVVILSWIMIAIVIGSFAEPWAQPFTWA